MYTLQSKHSHTHTLASLRRSPLVVLSWVTASVDAAETVFILYYKEVKWWAYSQYVGLFNHVMHIKWIWQKCSLMCQVEEEEVDLPGLELIEDSDCGCHMQVWDFSSFAATVISLSALHYIWRLASETEAFCGLFNCDLKTFKPANCNGCRMWVNVTTLPTLLG